MNNLEFSTTQGSLPSRMASRKTRTGKPKVRAALASDKSIILCNDNTNDAESKVVIGLDIRPAETPVVSILEATSTLARINATAEKLHRLYEAAAADTFSADVEGMVECELELDRLWAQRRAELFRKRRGWEEREVRLNKLRREIEYSEWR